MPSLTNPGEQAADRPLPPPTGVVLADAFPVIGAALSLLIDAEPDLEVLAVTASSRETIEAVRKLPRRSGVMAVIGLNIGGEEDCYWLIRRIREEFPTWPILAFGSNGDPMAVSRALFFGTDGFVDKSAGPEAFVDAIRRTAHKEVVLEGLPADWLIPIADGIDRQREGASVLTDRERQVLSVAAQGFTARQIGSRLGLRERTVTTHLSRIYKKLGAAGRLHAIDRAARSGLISLHASD
jgi:DNA-binding NarL/FixJ family response regulator